MKGKYRHVSTRSNSRLCSFLAVKTREGRTVELDDIGHADISHVEQAVFSTTANTHESGKESEPQSIPIEPRSSPFIISTLRSERSKCRSIK